MTQTSPATSYTVELGQIGCLEAIRRSPRLVQRGAPITAPMVRRVPTTNATRTRTSARPTDFSGTTPVDRIYNNAGRRRRNVRSTRRTRIHPYRSGRGATHGCDFGGAGRAADFNVYWGPWQGRFSHRCHPQRRCRSSGQHGRWLRGSQRLGQQCGRLRRRTTRVVTVTDLGCVEPLKTGPPALGPTACGLSACTSAAPFFFRTARSSAPSPFIPVHFARLARPSLSSQAGFLLYIAGRVSVIRAAGAALPSSTVWTMRNYTGYVSGGNGADGGLGPSLHPAPRPFTALGA